MVSLSLFTALVALLALQRIWELRRSRWRTSSCSGTASPLRTGRSLRTEPSEALMGLAGLGLLLNFG